MWNFFLSHRHQRSTQAPAGHAVSPERFFGLRSLSGGGECARWIAIPGRFYSSSLPPLFASGRFANLSSTAEVQHVC